MGIPNDLKYTKDHEWLRAEGTKVFVGITDHAQEALGDVVFVELPAVGKAVAAGDAVAVVESVKAVADVYSAVAGKVAGVNEALTDDPGLLNADPYGQHVFVIQTEGGLPDTLMDGAEYARFLEESGQ